MMTDKQHAERDCSDFSIDYSKPHKPYAPPKPRDTEGVEISDSSPRDVGGFKIPPSGTAATDKGNVPQKKLRTSDYSRRGADFSRERRKAPGHDSSSDALVTEYEGNGYIRHVTVKSWPASYSFYEKFVRDAAVSHSKKGSPAPHAAFFSYIPQYSQLTAGNYAYYQYMKEQIRNGTRLSDADFSYVLLYIYEIINLEGIISPDEGAQLLARTWLLYRPMHPSIDKYLAEWMADYCLVYNIPLPSALSRCVCELGAKSTLKEFYADAAFKAGVPLGKLLRMSLSDHNPGKGRYAKENPDFVREVEEVFDAVIAEHMERGEGVFSPNIKKSASVTRDAFCGSLCSSNIKKKLVLELHSFFRAPEARRIITELMKGSENIVRARYGIKSRLAAPQVTGYSAVITAKNNEERAYLSLYESPAEPLSAENAARIEEESWQNVSVLTDDLLDDGIDLDESLIDGALSTDGLTDEKSQEAGSESAEDVSVISAEKSASAPASDGPAVPAETAQPESFDSDDFSSLISANAEIAAVLRAAMNGESFAAACRSVGLFAADAASRINELAADHIGDIVLEQDGIDYVFVEDYREDISI